MDVFQLKNLIQTIEKYGTSTISTPLPVINELFLINEGFLFVAFKQQWTADTILQTLIIEQTDINTGFPKGFAHRDVIRWEYSSEEQLSINKCPAFKQNPQLIQKAIYSLLKKYKQN